MALTTISDYKDCIDLVYVKYYDKTLGLECGVPIISWQTWMPGSSEPTYYFHCLPIAL